MSAYVVSLRFKVMETLRGLRRAERERILLWMERLEGDPFGRGEYVEKDDSGREIQVVIVGNHALYYWLDAPVKEIKIVKISPADG